ncbi:MAG TPA: hypothetical protein VFK41_03100 [Nocardioidaceae bacterium]|nr:hypothetical protein [Nocardioidaceae bacterium]
MATRSERVVLSLQDDYSGPVARCAAATRLLNEELDRLDNRTLVSKRGIRSLNSTSDGVPALTKNVDASGKSIDRMSGRLKILVESGLAIGPAFVPGTTAATAVLAGLVNQLGVAVLAGGSAIIAFQGVGGALEALNKAHLEPTRENLAAARTELLRLSPAAQDFVKQLLELRGAWSRVKDAAAQGLLPGVGEALDDLETRLPEVIKIVRRMNTATGSLLAEAGEELASKEWNQFFRFLRTDAIDTLRMLGKTTGNLARGAAELWMAFDPLNDFFSMGLLEGSRNFAKWADELDQTEGFQEFVAYVQQTGPQVLDTVQAIGGAFLEIGEAAAPLGGPTLQILEAIADVVSAIADSPFGTPILTGLAAVSAFNRGTAVTKSLMESTWGARAQGNIKATAAALVHVTSAQDRARLSAVQMQAAERKRAAALGSTAAALGGMAFVASGAADQLGVANTATMALTGAMIGGAPGAAVGGLVGGIMDLGAALQPASGDLARFIELLEAKAGPGLDSQISAVRAEIEKLESDGSKNFWLGSDQELFGIGTSKLSGLREELKQLEHQRELEGLAAKREAAATATHTRTLEENIAALRARRDENLRGLSAETAYHGALLDAKDAFKENGKTLDLNTRAGLANRSALERIVSTWNALSETAKASPGAFKEARKDLINQAIQFGMTEEAARRYAKRLLQVPTKVPTEVDLSIDEAVANVRKIRQEMAAIRDRTINLFFKSQPLPKPGAGDGYGVLAPPPGDADGGTIPGQRTPYGDKVLRMLAPGEEVVSNRFGQADRNRAALKAANRGAKLTVVGHGDGGTVARAFEARSAMRSGWRTSYGERDAGTAALTLRGMTITGALEIPGFGPAYIRGVVEDVQADNSSFAGAKGRMRHRG